MTPLERAARAICAQHAMYEPDMMVVGRDGGSVPYWTEFSNDARAVLQALREPSDRMLSDGAFQIMRGERITEEDLDAAKRVWRGMTHAMLSE